MERIRSNFVIVKEQQMKNLVTLTVLIAMSLGSCTTIVTRDGKKHRQLFPARDKSNASVFDANRFVMQSFDISHYANKVDSVGGKKLIELIDGKRIATLAKSSNRYYIFLWNPGCSGNFSTVKKFDSLARLGNNVILVSLRTEYEMIDRQLRNMVFSQYPYYVIDAKKYSNIIASRQFMFVSDACEGAREKYRDDLAVVDYLLVENGKVTPVVYNDPANILRH
jgi:hypothetical protein